ncbi:hypothetical protein EDD76_10885 [Kineothrix alysoides]|uniref:Uncharacterized protein n=1 Tax=Kineothrix alysoides TaxID=1469948 RepID=A0A4R1QYG9_9FIRM|nr:hypothetical protein EDD76_10885 [Kineothrix alysoides]
MPLSNISWMSWGLLSSLRNRKGSYYRKNGGTAMRVRQKLCSRDIWLREYTKHSFVLCANCMTVANFCI